MKYTIIRIQMLTDLSMNVKGVFICPLLPAGEGGMIYNQ